MNYTLTKIIYNNFYMKAVIEQVCNNTFNNSSTNACSRKSVHELKVKVFGSEKIYMYNKLNRKYENIFVILSGIIKTSS